MVSITWGSSVAPLLGRAPGRPATALEYTVTDVDAEVEQPLGQHRRRTVVALLHVGGRRVPLDGHAGERAVEVEDAHRRRRTRARGHGDELTHAPDTTASAGAAGTRRPSNPSSWSGELGVLGHVEPGAERTARRRACRSAARSPSKHASTSSASSVGVLAGRAWRRPTRGPARRGTGARSTPPRAPVRTTPRTAAPSRPGRGTPRPRPARSRRRRAADRCRARRRRAGRPPASMVSPAPSSAAQ